MSYLVPRVYPSKAIIKHFDQALDVINLSDWRADLDLRVEEYNRGFWSQPCCLNRKQRRTWNQQQRTLSVYFPLYDQFYVTDFDHVGPMSFEELIERIYEAGVYAFTYDIKLNPNNFVNHPTPEEIVEEYALMSGDITYVNDGPLHRKVYVNLQH